MAVKITEEGFLQYTDTLFFRGGVFEYAGCEIDPDGTLFGLEPNKIYNVYRPESEVTNPKFVESLNAKPLVDDHTIIGNGKGMMKPERKNCAGVLTKVEVVKGELRGQVDVWSTKMIDKIRGGKRELSLAYGCSFEQKRGVYKGKRYDFVQSGLRAGNHLALVDEARNGHDCRVVDCAFCCDAKFQLEQSPMDWKNISADDLLAGLKECSDECKAKAKEFLNTPSEDEAKKLEAEKKAAEEKAAKDAAEAAAKVEAEKKEAVDKAVAECNEKAAKDAAEAAEKAEADKQSACDSAVAEYKKAVALAEDCKAKFGNIAMDGIKTEKELAAKICAMDAAPAFLKSVKSEDAIVALRGYIAGSGVAKNVKVGDGKTATKTLADFIK